MGLGFLVFVMAFSGCDSGNAKKANKDRVSFRPQLPLLPIDSPDIPQGKLYDILSCKTTGIDHSNHFKLSFKYDFYSFIYLIVGAGTGIGDLDNDGLPDVVLASNLGKDKIYKNLGDLKFEEVSQKSGFAIDSLWSTGITLVDINQDGLLDIYVCRSYFTKEPDRRKNQLYINQGDMKFLEQGEQYGLADTSFSTHATFFDYDLDGDLDMYLVNYPIDWNDRRKYNNHEKIEKGINSSDKLYRNNGQQFFEDVTTKSGINNHGYGLSATVADLNHDGWPDVFVTNDWGMYDIYYQNNGDGTFADKSLSAFTKNSFSSMGSDIADINNDGYLDVVTAEMEYGDNFQHKAFVHSYPDLSSLRNMVMSGYNHQYYRNSLFVGSGDGSFSEIGRISGISSTDWSWSPLFLDADNDGFLDLFISNGIYRHTNLDERPKLKEIRDAIRRKDSLGLMQLFHDFDTVNVPSPNYFFHNNGNLGFSNKVREWGTNYPTISYGAAYADLDLDGDLDIITNNMNACTFIYRNNSEKDKKTRSFSVKLKGEGQNTGGIGAKVKIRHNGQSQMRIVGTSNGYMSSSVGPLHFGIGEDEILDEVEVVWPNGNYQLLTQVNSANQIVFEESGSMPARNRTVEINTPAALFTEFSDESGLVYQHAENDFDDFYKNSLLPKVYSRDGPGAAVGDVNGDGIDDLFLGGASGYQGRIFIQDEVGKFTILKTPALNLDKDFEDMGCLFLDVDNDNDLDLYVASGGSDFESNNPLLQDRLYLNDGKGDFSRSESSLPEFLSPGSCVIANDFDHDGDYDLFVGGKTSIETYPEGSTSHLLINEAGVFSIGNHLLPGESGELGLVSSALWTDVNNDQQVDLMIAGEWIDLKLFINVDGKFKDKTTEFGLDSTAGWWNSLAGFDYDQDGDTDYIAGNFGANTRYKPGRDQPITIHFGDFDKDEDRDVLLSYVYGADYFPIVHLNDLSENMSIFGEKKTSYSWYGRLTTSDLLAYVSDSEVGNRRADIFESVIFENIGGKQLKMKKLPVECQFGPIYGIQTGHFNADGYPDVIAVGNQHEVFPQFEKQDAIKGLLLLGNGQGSMEVVEYPVSGFRNFDEGRAVVVIGDKDDNASILVTNNNAESKHFKISEEEIEFPGFRSWEDYALLIFNDGRTEKIERYQGSGFLSGSSARIFVPKTMAEEVRFFDGEKISRTIKY